MSPPSDLDASFVLVNDGPSKIDVKTTPVHPSMREQYRPGSSIGTYAHDCPANDDHNTFPAGADSVTFVGRPFPLEEAPQQFARLRAFLTLIGTRSAWHPDGPSGGKCIWELHDIWGWNRTRYEPVLLRENYFIKNPATGSKVDWYTDFYFPFLSRCTERVHRASAQEKIVFVEAIPNEFCPTSWTPKHQVPNMSTPPICTLTVRPQRALYEIL
ncbi:hypothetical protein H0H93_008506 [Arthromyces matolae]|nr:hypothetical protein H0H93_008506 [Arthromyces matolae]